MSSVRFNPQAQRPEKKKKSLGEGADESRMARISFKNYLRELEEEDEDDDYMFEEEQTLPTDEYDVQELHDKFVQENDDLMQNAREFTEEEAICFLMNEMRTWLQRAGHSAGAVEDWLDGVNDDLVAPFELLQAMFSEDLT
jgi:hypothetical protein